MALMEFIPDDILEIKISSNSEYWFDLPEEVAEEIAEILKKKFHEELEIPLERIHIVDYPVFHVFGKKKSVDIVEQYFEAIWQFILREAIENCGGE